MKNIKLLTIMKIIILLFISFYLYSCSEKNKFNEYEYLLSGKHELRKFNVKSTTKTEASGCWFIIVGSYSSETIEESKIRFYFKSVKGEFIFKEMDYDKVYIKIDSLTDKPYVKFYWNNSGASLSGYEIYEYAITRAVIYCKDEDFQPEINLNNL